MTRPRTISLDAMGGDGGPGVVVPGAALALERQPELRFVLRRARAHRGRAPRRTRSSGRGPPSCTPTLPWEMQDKPSQAVRRGRGSSMWLALEAVQKRRGRRAWFRPATPGL